MRKSIRKLIAVASAGLMALTLAVTGAPTTASAEVSDAGIAAGKATFDPAGTYHAYFGLQQQESWIFRDEWYSPTLGIDGTSYTDGQKFDQGTLFQSKDNVITALEGTKVTDAEITGNGVYSVSVEGLDGVLTETAEAVISMLYVDTDIPMSAKDNPLTISDWKLALDGVEQALPANIFYPTEYTDESGLLRFDCVNTYQGPEGTNEYPENPSIVTPNDSIKITFTVSGMTNDNPDAVEQTSSSSASSSSSSSTTSDSGMSTGAVVGIVVVVVVVIAAIVVVVTKKKKD